jgi:hypothetical protein
MNKATIAAAVVVLVPIASVAGTNTQADAGTTGQVVTAQTRIRNCTALHRA